MPSRVHSMLLFLLFQVTHSSPNATLTTDQVGFAYLTKTVTSAKNFHFKNYKSVTKVECTQGSWLLWISVVRFSLMYIFFKKIVQISSVCNFHYISTLVGNSNDPPQKYCILDVIKRLINQSRLVKTGRNWSKLVETGQNCQNWLKLVMAFLVQRPTGPLSEHF